MNTKEFSLAIESNRNCECEGFTMPGSEKPWGVRWTCGAIDPFTEESPTSFYFTAAEAIRAAGSANRPYNPSDFPQTTELVEPIENV